MSTEPIFPEHMTKEAIARLVDQLSTSLKARFGENSVHDVVIDVVKEELKRAWKEFFSNWQDETQAKMLANSHYAIDLFLTEAFLKMRGTGKISYGSDIDECQDSDCAHDFHKRLVLEIQYTRLDKKENEA